MFEDFWTHSRFLSLAFAINILFPLWKGLRKQILRWTKKVNWTTEALAQEGPTDDNVLTEVNERKKAQKQKTKKRIRMGMWIGGVLASLIYVAMLFVPHDHQVTWWEYVLILLAGFSVVVWAVYTILAHWFASWRLSQWVLRETKTSASEAATRKSAMLAATPPPSALRPPRSRGARGPSNLRRYLSAHPSNSPVRMSFDQLEALLGRQIPAGTQRAKFPRWVYLQGELTGTGWSVSEVDFEGRLVIFTHE